MVKWIRLNTDMFSNSKIMFIRSLPEGNNILLIWIMLLTKAGKCNSNGFVFLTENIPYTTNILANELGFEESVVILAINTLVKLEMIQLKDEFINILGWEEHQNVDGLDKIKEQTKRRVAKHRENKRLVTCNDNVTLHNVTSNATVTQCNATDKNKNRKELDKELEENKELEKEKKKKEKPLANAQTSYFPNDEKLNSTFKDFMAMRKAIKAPMTERAVELMINKLTKYDNDTAIAMLEQSILNGWKDVYEKKSDSKGIDWSKV